MSEPSVVRRVRAAVVGCGAIAHEHLGYLSESPLVELVGACDLSGASAAFAVDRYGAAAAYTDAAEMLESTHPDVVHVLTPPHTHSRVAGAALDAGCDVLCEKPAAPTARELDELVVRATARGRRFMESQNLRFNDEVQLVHEAVVRGELGDVREVDVLLSVDFVQSRFGDPNLVGPGADLPGGAVHDFLPHLAYLFLMFATEPVDHVAGRLENRSGNERVGFDHLDGIVSAGAVRGRLRVASDLSPSAFRLVVRGTKASLETDLYNPYVRREGGANIGKRVPLEHLQSGARLMLSAFSNLRDKVAQHGTYHGLPKMLDAFYRAVVEGAPQPVSFDEMRQSAALVDRLVELSGTS